MSPPATSYGHAVATGLTGEPVVEGVEGADVVEGV
jgi:hypothetical protein